MSTTIASQRDLAGRISRAFDNLKKLGANNLTKGSITSHLQTLRKNWSKFENQQDELLAKAASDETLVANAYFKEKGMDVASMEEVFNVQEALLLDKLTDITKMEALATRVLERSATGEHHNAVAARPTSSLPKIPLPTFEGKHRDWPSFQGLFRSLVVLDQALTDAERLHYLRGALTGDAELLLRNIPESEENFQAAWELLRERYDNQRLAVKSIMASIFELPTLKQESGPELKRMLYTLWDSVKALATMKRPFDATGDWLVHLAAARLDPQSRREWETRIARTKTPPTFAEMREFLEARVNAVVALEESCKGTEGRSPRPARSA